MRTCKYKQMIKLFKEQYKMKRNDFRFITLGSISKFLHLRRNVIVINFRHVISK